MGNISNIVQPLQIYRSVLRPISNESDHEMVWAIFTLPNERVKHSRKLEEGYENPNNKVYIKSVGGSREKNYQNKYLKYKQKYLELKAMLAKK